MIFVIVDNSNEFNLNRYTNQPLWGYNITLRVDPIALAGKLVANLAKTAPLLPWLLEIRPQIVFNYIKFYSKTIFCLSRVSFINISNSLSKIIFCSSTIIDTFKSQDSLINILLYLWSIYLIIYLLKLRNLALTHNLTCLPGVDLAIFLLLFWATA